MSDDIGLFNTSSIIISEIALQYDMWDVRL